MKILYCVQLTGNGHVTSANELIPEFKKVAKVDVLTSGNQNSLEIKEKVNFKFRGLSFVFGSRGGVDIFKTILNLRPFTFIKDVFNFQVKKYDLIIIQCYNWQDDYTDQVQNDLKTHYSTLLKDNGSIVVPIINKVL